MWRRAAALTVLILASPAKADFAAGVAAYDRGDFALALESWLPLARNGDLAAQRNLGHLYRSGQGVPQDFEEASRWYRRAAEAGLVGAQVNLGAMYLRGQGVDEDPAEAARWFVLAARQGHPVAQYNLGAMLLKGLGVERSEPRALGWLNLSAKQGHRPALDLLSEIVQQPPPEAEEPAAGAPEARLEPAPPPLDPTPPSPPAVSPPAPAAAVEEGLGLAGLLSRAFGGLFAEAPAETAATDDSSERLATGVVALHAGNFRVARERLEPLAEAGNAEAQLQLGLLHARTDYASADPAQAWAWLELAARRGHANAVEARRQVEARLSDGQKAAARSFVDARASR